jgi:uncharacterized protein YdhG (YjbR/CyaY superfamily)
MKDNKEAKTIDEYIARFPKEIAENLQKLRKTIKEAAPDTEESMSYQMPAFRLNGILVYFAAFKDHISFFPTSSGVAAFRKYLADYKTSKGTIQFPLNKPIPIDLVKNIVKYRARENLKKITK